MLEQTDSPATPDEIVRLERFLAYLREHGRHERTLRAYQYDWQHFAQWFDEANGRPFSIKALRAADVEAYLHWCESHEGLKPSTLNRRLALLKHYTSWAMDREAIDTQRWKRIKGIPIRKKRVNTPRGLSPEEQERLLAVVAKRANARDASIIYTLLHAGVRTGELVQLIVSDLRLGAHHPTLTLRAETTIGGMARTIPLTQAAIVHLEAYLAEHPHAAHPESPLFLGRQGSLTPERVAAIVRTYADWARLKKVTPHTLRHTFAYTFLAERRGDIVSLAELLGHTDLATTRIYLRKQKA